MLFRSQHVKRRRATLPHPLECSTIAAPGLSYRVRKMGDSLMVNLMPLNEEEKQQLAANPHNANTIVFNRGMSMAKMIGSSARTSKVYTYMKDHYLNLVIVAKDYDDNGARGSGVLMVSKQDNSDDVMLILFKGPDITNSKIEKVIGSMLSAHFERK